MVKTGDVIDNCPSCGKERGVVYRGLNEKDEQEAVCSGCGEIFEVSFEDNELEEEEVPAPAPAPTPAPAPAPAPPPPPQPVAQPAPAPAPAPAAPRVQTPTGAQALPELAPVSANKDPKAALKLSEDGVDDFTNGGSDIPAYIRNSRAWRWAQKMGKTGNPYREGSKNHSIYAIYAQAPCTVEQCVKACADAGYNDKLSYLLTVYEVTAHCLASGLLVMDPDSRKIAPCQGKPVPTKVT